MRIGLVIEHFNPYRGGAEQWTYQFTERLLAAGHEVHVVAGCFDESTDDMPLLRHTVERIGSRLGFATAAEKKLRKLSLDVIHDMGSGWYCDLFESHDGSRTLDMSKIKTFLIGFDDTFKGVIYMDNVRLENDTPVDAK